MGAVTSNKKSRKQIKLHKDLIKQNDTDLFRPEFTEEHIELQKEIKKYKMCIKKEKETLLNNNIVINQFSGALSKAIEKGRGKEYNILMGEITYFCSHLFSFNI